MSSAALIPDDDSVAPSTCPPIYGCTQHGVYGSDDAMDIDPACLRRDREREGRCADCGVQTHFFEIDSSTNVLMKVPLTVAREVHRGRCLLCHPVYPPENESQRAAMSCSGARPPTRRVSQANFLGLHNPNDSAVVEALSILEDSSFDIAGILSAMKMVPYDYLVQEKACERLWVLSWDEESAVAIGRVGGIELILSAMEHFSNKAHLQLCACESLQNLALIEENRLDILENRGVQLLVQAMIRHRDFVSLQRAGCTAIGNMALSRESHKYIAGMGGLHSLVLATKNFSHEPMVLRAAHEALSTLEFLPQGLFSTVQCQ